MSNRGPQSQTILAAGGMDGSADAALDRNTIRSERLEALAKNG